jgi:hypothetical protein
MASGVVLNMAIVSPLLSALQAWLSSSIVNRLRRELPLAFEDFLTHYRGEGGPATSTDRTSFDLIASTPCLSGVRGGAAAATDNEVARNHTSAGAECPRCNGRECACVESFSRVGGRQSR